MGVLTSSSIFIEHLLIHKTYMVRLSLKRGLGFLNLRLFFCVCECWIYLSVFPPWTRLSWPDTPRSAQTSTSEKSTQTHGIEEPPRQETLSCTSSSHVFCLTNYHSDTLDLCHFLFIVYAINSNNVEKKRIRPTFKTLLHPWRGEKFGRWRNKQSVCSREGS